MTRIQLGPIVLVAVLVVALAAAPAFGAVYNVHLTNGESYETRHPPEEASWDPDVILIHTGTGNWIGLERDQIARVESETDVRGYGRRIDATTIYMGRLANAAPPPGQEGQEQDPQLALLQALYDQQQQQQSHTIDQFVDPSDTGQGIPVGFTQQVTPPLGGIPGNNPR